MQVHCCSSHQHLHLLRTVLPCCCEKTMAAILLPLCCCSVAKVRLHPHLLQTTLLHNMLHEPLTLAPVTCCLGCAAPQQSTPAHAAPHKQQPQQHVQRINCRTMHLLPVPIALNRWVWLRAVTARLSGGTRNQLASCTYTSGALNKLNCLNGKARAACCARHGDRAPPKTLAEAAAVAILCSLGN